MGAEVGTYDPGPGGENDSGQYPDPHEFGDDEDPARGCTLDGMLVLCSDLNQQMRAGATGEDYLVHNGRRWEPQQVPIEPLGIGMFVTPVPDTQRNDEGPYVRWQDLVFSFAPQRTEGNACKEMARQAQRIANDAMEEWRGDKAAALIRFDNEFSRFYLGHEGLGSMSPKAFNDAPVRPAANAVIGGEGFKPEYRDSVQAYYDQTHHFAAHLTAGINKAWLTSTAQKATDSIPYFSSNAGDRRLTDAAYKIGEDLRKDRLSMWSIGDRILADLCDP